MQCLQRMGLLPRVSRMTKQCLWGVCGGGWRPQRSLLSLGRFYWIGFLPGRIYSVVELSLMQLLHLVLSVRGSEESGLHLFMCFPLAQHVWYDVFRWLGWQLPLPPDLFSLLAAFCAFGHRVRAKRGLNLIWHTVLWVCVFRQSPRLRPCCIQGEVTFLEMVPGQVQGTKLYLL